jgi:hypothetical protein
MSKEEESAILALLLFDNGINQENILVNGLPAQ